MNYDFYSTLLTYTTMTLAYFTLSKRITFLKAHLKKVNTGKYKEMRLFEPEIKLRFVDFTISAAT